MACAWCKHPHDEAVGLNSETRPQAGAIFLCIACGHVNVMFGASALRRATEEELLDFLDTTPELVVALVAWQLAFGKKRDNRRS
jgi:hypothetical protein